jgi:threonine/homoserine/homoserine lactone efflux protein
VIKIIFKGFKFGMLLQMALGPVSIFIFNMANNNGFIQAEMSVLAVTIVDALYIFLAVLGITSLLEKDKVKVAFKIFSAIILGAFGVNIIFGVFGIEIMQSISLIKSSRGNGLGQAFALGFIMTASNPLTILFWTGIFGFKISEDQMNKKDLMLFGLGAVIPTFICQTFISVIGIITRNFFSFIIIDTLNIVVGIALIYFAIKLLKKKETTVKL